MELLLEQAQGHAAALAQVWPEIAGLRSTLEFARRPAGRPAVAEAVALILALLAIPLVVSTPQARTGGLRGRAALRSIVFFRLAYLLSPVSPC